jgi:hypothetical protein
MFVFVRRDWAGLRLEPSRLRLREGSSFSSWLGRLPRGSYQLTWSLDTDTPVLFGGADMARLEIVADDSVLAAASVVDGAHELSLRFEADGKERVGYRFASWSSQPLYVTSARLAREEP